MQRFFFKNANDPFRISVSVRLNAEQYQAVREFMHTEQHETQVMFPREASLAKVGCGWYILRPRNDYMARETLTTAIRIITKAIFMQEQKSFAAKFQDNPSGNTLRQGHKTQAFVDGKFVLSLPANPIENSKEKRAASITQLQALVSKFGPSHRNVHKVR